MRPGRWCMGNGWSKPAGHWWEDLMMLQVTQCWMKVLMSFSNDGYQNHPAARCAVAVIPGWPELGDSWINCMTRCWRHTGTYVRFCGQSGGVGSSDWAAVISIIMSHWTGAGISVAGMMGPLSELEEESESNCLQRVSALPFLVPDSWNHTGFTWNKREEMGLSKSDVNEITRCSLINQCHSI